MVSLVAQGAANREVAERLYLSPTRSTRTCGMCSPSWALGHASNWRGWQPNVMPPREVLHDGAGTHPLARCSEQQGGDVTSWSVTPDRERCHGSFGKDGISCTITGPLIR